MAPKNPPSSKKRTRSPSPPKTHTSTAKKAASCGKRGKALKPFTERATTQQSMFYSDLLTSKLHIERGIDLPAVDPSITEEVNRRNWTKFVFHPREQFNVTLVKEFLALLYKTEKTTTSVRMRGVMVDFSPSAIMKHFDIPDFPLEEHYELVWDLKDSCRKSAKDIEAKNFLDENAVWSEGRFCYNNVSSVAKVWSYFVNFRLLPSTHLQNINRDEALAIYAILTKFPVHVGHVIHQAIINYVTKGGPRIPFPNTIAAMVVAAKVPQDSDDKFIESNSPIIGAKLVGAFSSAATPPAPKQRKQVYLSDIEYLCAALHSDMAVLHSDMAALRSDMAALRFDMAALRSDIHAMFERQRVCTCGVPPTITTAPTVPRSSCVDSPLHDSAEVPHVDMSSFEPVTLIDNPQAPFLMDSSVRFAAQVVTDVLQAKSVPFPTETVVDDMIEDVHARYLDGGDFYGGPQC